MTYEEFMKKTLDTFPGAQVSMDNEGQLIVYTDLMSDDSGEKIVPFVVAAEDES